MDPVVRKARTLLAVMRRTPMRRGAISKPQDEMRAHISQVIEAEQVPADLSRRIAFQLALKIQIEELGNRSVWRAVGKLLRQDIEKLRTDVGLSDRQIVTVLPKLSAVQVASFFAELQQRDRRVARTILNASLDAADPVETGQRYLEEYRHVAEQIHTLEPAVARTLANASFTASAPQEKAIEHLNQFAELLVGFRQNLEFVRSLGKGGTPPINRSMLLKAFSALTTRQ
jgi:hypothetical protein